MLRRQYQQHFRQWTTKTHSFFFKQSTQQRIRTATSPPQPAPTPNSARIERVLRRCPKFLRPSLSALYNAPVTHITAFLILHEVTAVVPLFGLAGAFHYFQWLPPYFAEGAWVLAGVERFGNYFRKKGWIDAREQKEAKELAEEENTQGAEGKGKRPGRISRWWGRGEVGTRIVIEFATAYAMVKLFLPIRLVVSAWGAAWFARWTVIPVSNSLKRIFVRGPKTSSKNVSGTDVSGRR